MTLRVRRAAVGGLLVVSGALMYAASWQRWAGACSWGETEGAGCEALQDHRYDFVAPTAPWEPVGHAAQLAGGSLLVLALVFALLPRALTGRRPGTFPTVAVVGAVLALAAVGAATLRSGSSGAVVRPWAAEVVVYLWLLVPVVLLIQWTIIARGWAARLAAACLLLATPVVAAFTYGVGPYDAQPWWEGVSGAFTGAAGLCVLVAAAFGDRWWTRETASAKAAPTVTYDAASSC